MSEFVSIELDVDRGQARDNAFAAMAARFPGWSPNDGNLETWLIAACADLAGDMMEAAVDVPAEIFRAFGQKIAGVPTIDAAPAAANTTWTTIDDSGYTIPAGTLVQIAATGSVSYAFEVQDEVLIDAGSTTTETGEVVLVAKVPGSAPNGLESDPTLLDSLAFVDTITLESTVSGGVDAEDPDDYLDRLVEVIRLQSPRPILASDAAILARTIPGVWRATALDLYDPDTDTYDNERTVTVAVVDEDGEDCADAVKDAVEALLTAEREANFVFHAIDPTRSTIKVSTTVTALEGFDPAAVAAAVEAALANYLSPGTWGLPLATGDDPRAWRNVTTVRRNELIALVDRVAGVDYVSALTLAKGSDSLATSDVTLDGPAGLPEPGTMDATVS